jgi:hypothetical protein
MVCPLDMSVGWACGRARGRGALREGDGMGGQRGVEWADGRSEREWDGRRGGYGTVLTPACRWLNRPIVLILLLVAEELYLARASWRGPAGFIVYSNLLIYVFPSYVLNDR